ncbi:hypothetical protein P171DRAFT_447876 [Karstenula rhodostoma CBS 690.94]|uniref:RING-type domain-containing protein n=1 Tax=Karstenula rhodostoma CBS 690.94 TaxID=1392251 RepID=A0A9P4PBB9_9PLEO|nr:hypothetical protein P171DRAFT_447876 [Karstenula rhodostoma CBS 690.94]
MDDFNPRVFYLCMSSPDGYINFASNRLIPSTRYEDLYEAIVNQDDNLFNTLMSDSEWEGEDEDEEEEEDNRIEDLVVRQGMIDEDRLADITIEQVIQPTRHRWIHVWQDEVLQQYLDDDDEDEQRREMIAELPRIEDVRVLNESLEYVNPDILKEDEDDEEEKDVPKECSICLNPYFNDPDEMPEGFDFSVVRTTCNHIFHKACLMECFDTPAEGNGVGKCPMCRKWLCYDPSADNSSR